MIERLSVRKSGFTLIELLVVIAIIAILAAILFPVFAKAREKARQTTCLNNQRQITTSILMFVQDHDETFPTAETWVTELASAYGVTGKVWDCPTSSYKGTEAGPDYFYVGGSFLSGMALGDVQDPTAALLIADLASAKSKKPYIEDNGINDCEIAANTVDCRHNSGAVFAFADGHTGWISSTKVDGFLFMDSIDRANLASPAYVGMLSKKALDYTTSELRKVCVSYGMDIAIGKGYAADRVAIGRGDYDASYALVANEFMTPVISNTTYYKPPSWWKLGVGGCTVVAPGGAPQTSNTWSRASGGNYVGTLCGGAGGSTYPASFTIVPTLSGNTAKKMALVANATTAATATATLVSIQYGTDPVIPINRQVSVTGDGGNLRSNAGVFLVPVIANKNLTINISASGSASNVGALLVFED
ncbi:MAG: type II secretion system protein [Armatimonadota bacterium]